jgi:hypothetical protein
VTGLDKGTTIAELPPVAEIIDMGMGVLLSAAD